jgi:hypothetical protein
MVDFPIEAVEIKKKIESFEELWRKICSRGHAQSIPYPGKTDRLKLLQS